MGKTPQNYRLREETISYIESRAGEWGLSKNAALERIIREHQEHRAGSTEALADALIKKLKEEYDNTFVRTRLAATAAERNTLQLLELANTFFASPDSRYNFLSTETRKSPILQAAEDVVKQRIAGYKQKADFRKAKGKAVDKL